MKITKVDEAKVEEVMKRMEEENKEGIPGYMDDVLHNILELFVRVQRIEDKLKEEEDVEER